MSKGESAFPGSGRLTSLEPGANVCSGGVPQDVVADFTKNPSYSGRMEPRVRSALFAKPIDDSWNPQLDVEDTGATTGTRKPSRQRAVESGQSTEWEIRQA